MSQFADKCIVISNCIRPKRLEVTSKIEERAMEIRRLNEGKTICFAVGRHVSYKGMGYLVRASKLLDDSIAIRIGGKGPLTEFLQEEAKEDGKITFLGRISDEELIANYLACDLTAFPSITKNEAFGIALAEGMYFGKPAVTFTIPGSGVHYVNLNEATGLEADNGDVEQYAKLIKKISGNNELRKKYGDAARERVKQYFSYDSFKENIKCLLLFKG